MKSTITMLVFFLMSQIGFAQLSSRKLLRGQVVNDSVKVENVVVFNVNARTGTIAKFEGAFAITAKENDTLVFSSLMFRSKKMVLTKEDMEQDVVKITLQSLTNQLAQVNVDQSKIKSPIKNSQEAVDTKYYGDAQSSPKNTVMPNYNVIENGVDFVRMYKDVLKVLRKKNPKKNDFTTNVSFTEAVMNRVSYSFFSNSLKLRNDQIKLFLVFSENDPKSGVVLKKATDFELMDFLVGKNNEFKKITAIQK
ncbi:hypothetical protein [Flavobacterium sp.]|uniref:hypothetical protein n=1 Tax=Flavobacterium sp. TaxID=239 RepID=UPI00261F69D3|nr:hypothetical protein [Flavobacterium sp.]